MHIIYMYIYYLKVALYCEIVKLHYIGGRIMADYVFSKWRSAAILDFRRSKIWRYFCFQDVGFFSEPNFV